MKKQPRHPQPAAAETPWIVRLDRVRDAPLPLDREIPQADVARMLQVEPPTLFAAVAPAQLTARLQRSSEKAFVLDGQLATRCESECRRCLVDVALEVKAPLHLELVPEAAPERGRRDDEAEEPEVAPAREPDDDGRTERSGSFQLEEADRVPIHGQEADLFALLQEQLLLALPGDALCKEDCRGLCQLCGQNLNERDCGCERKIPDPRWAALKGIKL